PSRAANALAVTNAKASHGTLEGTENQFLAGYPVYARPEKIHALVQSCNDIRCTGQPVGFAFDQRADLGKQHFVSLFLGEPGRKGDILRHDGKYRDTSTNTNDLRIYESMRIPIISAGNSIKSHS